MGVVDGMDQDIGFGGTLMVVMGGVKKRKALDLVLRIVSLDGLSSERMLNLDMLVERSERDSG